MAEVIKLGDVVRLKSGGADMVVDALSSATQPETRCVWHDTAGTPYVHLYLADVLEVKGGAKAHAGAPDPAKK